MSKHEGERNPLFVAVDEQKTPEAIKTFCRTRPREDLVSLKYIVGYYSYETRQLWSGIIHSVMKEKGWE